MTRGHPAAISKGSSAKDIGPTWSNLWKNRPVKQKRKAAVFPNGATSLSFHVTTEKGLTLGSSTSVLTIYHDIEYSGYDFGSKILNKVPTTTEVHKKNLWALIGLPRTVVPVFCRTHLDIFWACRAR